MGIRAAGNTMIPAFCAIAAKGYSITIWHNRHDDGDLSTQFDAQSNGRSFSATSPEELLGLIAMWEVRGDDWQLKSGEAELWDRLMKESIAYDSDGNVVSA
ncbi:MAG TPA: hypothetical protein VGM98_24030 [Schlesneria sp.]|jgi:hypothetical protein